MRQFFLWAVILAFVAGTALAETNGPADTEPAAEEVSPWWPQDLAEWVQVLTGPAVLFALYVALRRAKTADRQAETAAKQAEIAARQASNTEQGQVTERLTRAVEQLSSGEVCRRLTDSSLAGSWKAYY